MDLDKQKSAVLGVQVTHNDGNTRSLEKPCADVNKSESKLNITEENYINIESDIKSVDISLISDPDIKEFIVDKNLYNSDKSNSTDPIPPKRQEIQQPSPESFEQLNNEDFRAKISLSLENKQRDKIGNMDKDIKDKVDENINEDDDEFEVHFRPQKCEAQKGQNRMSFMMKTKGQLFYKKKGPFSKWKEHFALLDESKLHVNFFKSQEDYEKLARCKVSVDLRFVTEIKPIKPRFLQSSYPFKMHRRAGLSTVKLAAYNEEERAKWITMIENIMEKGKIMSDLHSIAEEKRSSTLPNRINESVRNSTDSETHTTASAPENEDQIRPKKVSASSGFKLDSHQISSVKLKRVSSEVSEPRSPVKKVNEEGEEVFDPKEKFGVQLRRVQTEKLTQRAEREQSPEYIEFKEKYNSLSLSRKNKAPKLPLNENSVCSHLVVNISREEEGETDTKNLITNSPSNEVKASDSVQRKRSPSPNIPISKVVEAVIKNKSTEEPQENLLDPSKPKLSICHATSTVISYYESSDLNINERANSTKDRSSVDPPDIVSSSTVEERNEKETITTTSSIMTATKPDIVKSSHITKIELKGDSNDEVLETESLVKEDKTLVEDARNDIEHKDSKFSTTNSSDESIPTEKEVEETETSAESCKSVSDQPLIISTIIIETTSEVEESSSTDKVDITEESLIMKNEHVKVDITIPTIKDITNEEPDLPKDESSKEIIERKRHSKPAKGIMTQSQIDSIVFGEEYKPSDTENELVVPGKNEESRLSFSSYQSQVSTESDEPLPRFNFLGKGDRSSSDSADIRSSLIAEESEDIKSVESGTLNEQLSIKKDLSLKSHGTRDKDTIKDSETRSSLILPEFTVVEESVEEYTPEEKKHQEDIKIISDTGKEEFIKETVKCEIEVSVSKENEEREPTSEEVEFKEILEENENGIKCEVHIETLKNITSLNTEVNVESKEYLKENESITELDISNTSKEIEKEIQCIKVNSESLSLSNEKENIEETSPIGNELIDTPKILVWKEDVPVIHNIDTETKINNNVEIIVHQESHSSQSDECSDDTSEKINDNANQIIGSDSNNKVTDSEVCLNTDTTKKESNLCTSQHINSLLGENTLKEIKHENPKDHFQICDNKTTDNCNYLDTEKNTENKPSTEQNLNSLSEGNKKILKEIEYEETEDYFPTFGTVEYRLKGEEYLEIQDNSIRTSGIQGLKEFLKENDSEGYEQEYKSGISRLGHSPAIEKLRKETP